MMHRPTRLKITDVNPHLICILCGGYLIDATTMIECLHSYCRACIVAYLRQSRQCPRCDTVVHKTRPLLNIRSDKTLQNLVYKLVPNLFKDEMKRRRDFYAKHPQASTSMQSPNAREERGEVCEDSLVIYTEDEHISLSLDYYFAQPRKDARQKISDEGGTNANGKRPNGDANGLPGDVVEKRYLRCPAAVCIVHIKKFIRNKFGLSPTHRIEVVHQNGEDEPLRDDYTLMDIAYIYTWRRNGPLPLLFRVFEPYSKRRKGSQSSISSSESVSSKTSGHKPSSPAAPGQRSSSKAPSPLSFPDKDKHFQKPQANWKAAQETPKVPGKPMKVPSSDIPGPSRKLPPVDRNANVPQKNNVGQHDKASTSSTTNPIKKSSSTNAQVKNTIIVTLAKPVSTSFIPGTSASLIVPKITNTLSPVVVNSPKTNLSSLNGKAPSLKPEKSCTTTSLTSPIVSLTSSKKSVPPSKSEVTSQKSGTTSSNSAPKVDTTLAVVTCTTHMSPKPTVPLSKNNKVASKSDMASAKPDMTPANPCTKPANPDMPLKSDLSKPKPAMTSQKADTTPIGLTLSSARMPPPQVTATSANGQASVPAETDKPVTLPDTKMTSPGERSGKEKEKLTAPEGKNDDMAGKQTKNEIKIDRASLNTEDQNNKPTPTEKTPPTEKTTPIDVTTPIEKTTSSEKTTHTEKTTLTEKTTPTETTPAEKTTPIEKTIPNEKTTPPEKKPLTENCSTTEEPMDVSVSDDVMMDTQVLLQT